MIWGLFAVTPVIVRMKTSTYLDSDWCHRESELLDFIVECCDFVRGRQFIDATLDQIETLDHLLPAASALNAQAQAAQFPGQRQVLIPPRLNELEAALLAGVNAARLVAQFFKGSAAHTNQLVSVLCQGVSPPLPCISNNPTGWAPYIALFTALTAVAQDQLPVAMTADLDAEALQREIDGAERVPDFGDGRFDVLDVLAAQEWVRVELAREMRNFRKQILIDCRTLTRSDWEQNVGFCVQRGLAAVATPIPVWFLQRAEGRVDQWPLIGDVRPIFTQHVENQFAWMFLVSTPRGWAARYADECGMAIAPRLRAALQAGA
jgi:hypothetical protein